MNQWSTDAWKSKTILREKLCFERFYCAGQSNVMFSFSPFSLRICGSVRAVNQNKPASIESTGLSPPI